MLLTQAILFDFRLLPQPRLLQRLLLLLLALNARLFVVICVLPVSDTEPENPWREPVDGETLVVSVHVVDIRC